MPRGSSNESDSFTGAMVRLVGVCRPAYGKATKVETVHYLRQWVMVSPTGLDGFCKGLNRPWGIPFEGFVNAA